MPPGSCRPLRAFRLTRPCTTSWQATPQNWQARKSTSDPNPRRLSRPALPPPSCRCTRWSMPPCWVSASSSTRPISGWSTPAGPAECYGIGKRMHLPYTRAMIKAALDGDLDAVPFKREAFFNLEIPEQCPGVPEGTAGSPGNLAGCVSLCCTGQVIERAVH